MRTLVCQPKGGLSTVRVYADASALVTGEFEAWSLRTGKQVLFVEKRLHRLLERHHVGGSYDQGAVYAFEYAEMCTVLREYLGPSDFERYVSLQQAAKASAHSVPWQRTRLTGVVAWRLAGLTGFVLYKTLATVVFYGVVAALLALFNKHR